MKRRNRSLIILITAAIVYFVLLLLLVAVESASPDASIHDLGDALWYSIITMTTVGYGDLAPVTAGGRILGLIFALCSIGLLTLLIGLGLNLVGRQVIPRLRLRRARNRQWYRFSGDGEASTAMALALCREKPDGLLIFPGESSVPEGARAICIDAGPEELLRIRGRAEGFACFYLDPENAENYTQALRTSERGITTYCLTDYTADRLPEALHLTGPSEMVSRSYWKDHPLHASEHCLVLIGCGETGRALLERALLTNIFEKSRRIEYHVFGETERFAALHPEIVRDLMPGASAGDSLVLYEGSWTAEPELLRRADRIVLCADEDRDNLETAEQLRRWFAVRGEIHVRLTEPVPGLRCFGTREACCTPEFVMKDALNRRAIRLNDIYNEGSKAPTAWRDLSEALRQSNIAAADHLIVKARLLLQDESLTELTEEVCRRAHERFLAGTPLTREACREIEHRRWVRFHRMYNWKYASERDNAMRLHPLLIPYEELPEEEQRKDDYAWEMLGRAGGARGGV
ncbi:MAG: ion transporter [Mogibacterium sp.]|nr:ion transporter [Mogibacterium sp.]